MSTPFSVVVVLHDSAQELTVLLDSLETHLGGCGPDLQVVCVDTGSRDRGARIAVERGCEVVQLGENPGFGAANNAGIAEARHDVCVLLNPDVELLDPGLELLVDRAREREALHVPRLLNLDGTVQRSAHPVPGRPGALVPALLHPRALPRGLRLRVDPWRAERPRRVGWAIAACLAAPTGLLRRLGPFDPQQFLFFEDLDLCLRAGAAGAPTILWPGVALRHAGQHSTRRAYAGEPHAVLSRRRREVVRDRLGLRALVLDDLAQTLTFASRAGARAALGRDASRERAQLRALREARRDG